MDRRSLLGMGVATLAPAAATTAPAAGNTPAFRYSLNTSTIRGQKLSLPETVDLTARAGYHALEPWINELEAYVKGGGSLPDLARRISDHGLTVESSIGFFEWVVDDPERRKLALEQARRAMELVRAIGGKRIAAPPIGATDRSDLDLMKAAERYRALLDLGAEMGVVPQVEVWGFSKCLNRLGNAAQVAVESGHADACVLADVYHLYKGGSGFGGLRVLSAASMPVFHVNDFPARIPREQIKDADRVFPGDGDAPWKQILGDLRAGGFRGVLSLELFNPEYWKLDAAYVARKGLQKLRAVAESTA